MNVEEGRNGRFDRDRPTRRAARARMSTEIAHVCAEAKSGCRRCRCSILRLQITELSRSEPGTRQNLQNQGHGPGPRLAVLESLFMSDRDTFGPRLRAERERRGISIDTIASVTKVGGDLWDGLERNDFSRWPSGIFARAFVRDYARAIGLDSDEVVDEFCRLFPLGDRRVSRLIQAQAQLIGHPLAYSESGAVPVDGDRRTVAPPSDESLVLRARIISRSLATALDAIGLARRRRRRRFVDEPQLLVDRRGRHRDVLHRHDDRVRRIAGSARGRSAAPAPAIALRRRRSTSTGTRLTMLNAEC